MSRWGGRHRHPNHSQPKVCPLPPPSSFSSFLSTNKHPPFYELNKVWWGGKQGGKVNFEGMPPPPPLLLYIHTITTRAPLGGTKVCPSPPLSLGKEGRRKSFWKFLLPSFPREGVESTSSLPSSCYAPRKYKKSSSFFLRVSWEIQDQDATLDKEVKLVPFLTKKRLKIASKTLIPTYLREQLWKKGWIPPPQFCNLRSRIFAPGGPDPPPLPHNPPLPLFSPNANDLDFWICISSPLSTEQFSSSSLS